MTRKPGKKRIMVQLWSRLAEAIERDFKAIHVKRDAYLNDLLGREIEQLADEVKFANSAAVRAAIDNRPLPDRKKLTLDLDETLVARIDDVLKERNIARDAFINRVLFFLVAKKVHLEHLGIAYERQTETSAKPLEDVWGFLHDPFFQIRNCNDGLFYTMPYFADGPFGAKGPNLFGLNTAINDSTWALMHADFDDLLLGLGEVAEREAYDANR